MCRLPLLLAVLLLAVGVCAAASAAPLDEENIYASDVKKATTALEEAQERRAEAVARGTQADAELPAARARALRLRATADRRNARAHRSRPRKRASPRTRCISCATMPSDRSWPRPRIAIVSPGGVRTALDGSAQEWSCSRWPAPVARAPTPTRWLMLCGAPPLCMRGVGGTGP